MILKGFNGPLSRLIENQFCYAYLLDSKEGRQGCSEG